MTFACELHLVVLDDRLFSCLPLRGFRFLENFLRVSIILGTKINEKILKFNKFFQCLLVLISLFHS